MDERTAALEDVYRRRYVGFRNVLTTVTHDRDAARDAVQEAPSDSAPRRARSRVGS